ncbi:MAG: 4Fe-4S binding protein [Clostridia bacterium]|nr:4Fe-4S binding protein [Clostridia bacterium]
MHPYLIKAELVEYMSAAGRNQISPHKAISPEYVGVSIFEEPLIGMAAADDPLFTDEFKREEVIGRHFKSPEEWLPGAKSVICFFLPFTEAVRASNRGRMDEPYDPEVTNQRCSALWLHGRVEGQRLVNALCRQLCFLLREYGHQAVAPSLETGFGVVQPYSSNWSERHAAYAAGLGTFSLSRGLITARGMAGRIGSVVTTAPLAPTPRPYSGPFDYCTMCGACQRRCPVGAIDATRGCVLGKDQNICGPYVNGSYLPPHGPDATVRYGCGKCQVGVPCEHQIPRR